MHHSLEDQEIMQFPITWYEQHLVLPISVENGTLQVITCMEHLEPHFVSEITVALMEKFSQSRRLVFHHILPNEPQEKRCKEFLEVLHEVFNNSGISKQANEICVLDNCSLCGLKIINSSSAVYSQMGNNVFCFCKTCLLELSKSDTSTIPACQVCTANPSSQGVAKNSVFICVDCITMFRMYSDEL